jgi:hypothetical protein
MTKQIDFWYADESFKDLLDLPVPAKKEISEWYKQHPKYTFGDRLQFNENGINIGIKSCIPFLDSMTSGYIIKLHCDILVEEDGGIFWKHQIPPATGRPSEAFQHIPNVPGFGKFSQVWEIPFDFKLPKGYSAIITQPFNKFDLNTYTTSAIVDGDYGVPGGQIPFAVKEGFVGVIEAGTPIIQIIPFKRDNWKMNFNETGSTFKVWNDKRKLVGWYKHNIWKKKSFD